MIISDIADRPGDMHPTRKLGIFLQKSGDVLVAIIQDGDIVGDADLGNTNVRSAQVEFCVSGGRSPRTYAALLQLMESMKQDNDERPVRPIPIRAGW